MAFSKDNINLLEDLHDSLQQEATCLQRMETNLTPQQKTRLTVLERYLGALQQALTFLDTTEPQPSTDNILLDGLYEGSNNEIFIELRIDEAVSGVISADIYRNSNTTGRSYVASIRTNPGETISRNAGTWGIIGSDNEANSTTGKLTLIAQSEEGSALMGTLFLDTALTGLPVRNDILFVAQYASPKMRRLGMEIEREASVAPLPTYNFKGEDITVRTCLETAGFEVGNVGESTIIPMPQQKWGTAQLHGLMVDLAQSQLNEPAWKQHLLLLSESSRDGLLGVMFDTTDPLPRQGSAVFAEEIRSFSSEAEFPRKLIQTTVHEIGHALNLAHRFEREVGRGDSTSFMNYDWRYLGGNNQAKFWEDFQFTFDKDELAFLRHAPRQAVIPGGAPFHSINYWSDGNGGYTPYVPEVPIDFLQLSLKPPASGVIFDFAQPVFLEIELKNLSDTTFDFTPELLDPKTGFLEILIRRRTSEAPAEHFIPIMERCFEPTTSRLADLPPNSTISNNLNLTFGSGGFPFAEPGEYEVTALLAFYDQQNQNELIVASNTLRIRIRFPQSAEAENDAMVLFQNEVGLYFALGGSSVLPKAKEALEDIYERRQGKKKTITDPIVANIIRCAGIDAARPYERYINGKFKHIPGDREKAASLLEQLSSTVLKNTFDAHTAKHTQALAKKHRKR
ncbi:MAG: acetyltransferase [Bacteroidota bacterium]